MMRRFVEAAGTTRQRGSEAARRGLIAARGQFRLAGRQVAREQLFGLGFMARHGERRGIVAGNPDIVGRLPARGREHGQRPGAIARQGQGQAEIHCRRQIRIIAGEDLTIGFPGCFRSALEIVGDAEIGPGAGIVRPLRQIMPEGGDRALRMAADHAARIGEKIARRMGFAIKPVIDPGSFRQPARGVERRGLDAPCRAVMGGACSRTALATCSAVVGSPLRIATSAPFRVFGVMPAFNRGVR